MGGSKNWLRSFISHKKANPDDQEKVGGGRRDNKWKPWRSSSSSDGGLSAKRGQVAASELSDFTASAANDVYSAAMATLIRAPPKNFLIVRKEWAAIRIQTAFRALLARRALRALKALVRLQAIVRGRLVRKQAAMTLKCMQALVRVQAQIKAHKVRASLEGKSFQRKPENKPDPSKQSELRANHKLSPWKKDSLSGRVNPNKIDKNSYTMRWEDEWGAFEQCEERKLMEEADLDFSLDSVTSSPFSTEHEKAEPKARAATSNSFEYETIGVTQNNTTKRVAATRPQMSLEAFINESLSSSSSSSSAATEGADESASIAGVGCSKPLYMSPRGSRRAKQRGVNKNQQREALYSPAKLDRYDWTRCH